MRYQPVGTRRWRKVQEIDEGWQYEERDRSFVAQKFDDHSEQDVDGWRPLVALWFIGGPDRPTFSPYSRIRPSPAKPWRTRLCGGDVTTIRDYETREQAQADVPRRLAAREERT